jgi:tripartite-type tricarboxylate transporter receptor subunit TctC
MTHPTRPQPARRQLLRGALAAGLAATAGPLLAQADFPAQTIRIVVPFAAGGTTDLLGRLVAEGLRTKLGQNVVVDNKAGAGGNIGAAEVARSAPNGYTLLLATPGPLAINQYTYASPGYDAERQFTAVSNIAMVPNVLMASQRSGIKSMADLLARAKAAPGSLNYGSAGNGSTSHLAAELIKAMAGVDMVHVPYKGVAPAMNDLIAGQIDLMFDNLPTAMPMIESGKVVPLGVSVKQRVATLPNVPVIADLLPGYEVGSWFGLVAPAGTPDVVLQKLGTAASEFVRSDATRERIAKMGALADGSSPADFGKLIHAEQAKFRDIVKRANIRVE